MTDPVIVCRACGVSWGAHTARCPAQVRAVRSRPRRALGRLLEAPGRALATLGRLLDDATDVFL